MRWRTALALALALGCWTAPARALVLHLSPAQPTVHDSIMVTAQGGFISTCWRDTAQVCATLPGDTLALTIDVSYCRGLVSCPCFEAPWPYTRSCRFGPLPAGAYVAAVTELHSGPYDGEPTLTQTLAFVVSDLTPVLPRSWGRLKTIYR
jgi:hypothetical protein